MKEKDTIVVPVLDKGYVLHKQNQWFLGNSGTPDLEPVNDARVSFDRESNSLTDKDIRLLKYLAKHGHTSPFRHSVIKFELYAPLMVARQLWKYIVGASHDEGCQDSFTSHNESSRRYISQDEEFYLPSEWRLLPEDGIKQGSQRGINPDLNSKVSIKYAEHVLQSEKLYKEALADGIAPEMARLFLPAYGLYVRWRMTMSLQSVCHLLKQRLEDDAQWECREYAKAILVILESKFPESIIALND